MLVAAISAFFVIYNVVVMQPLPVSKADLISESSDPACQPIPFTENTAAPHNIVSPDGLQIMVRTPLNYLSDRRFPLLVVFPPAGLSRRESERFYHLTQEATRDGMLVAYSDHLPLSRRAVEMQAGVADAVASRFCIDGSRIVYFGHSDGGSMAEGISTVNSSATRPRTIVASAAGIKGEDLDKSGCPFAANAMIVHNSKDELFPDFGRGTAAHWAKCAGCKPMDIHGDVEGCRNFEGCRGNLRVAYCEVKSTHAQWPEVNATALSFILSDSH
jgi:polyhydroxybutyrate depolymerase